MQLKRIIKLKEGLKDLRARELEEVNTQIEAISKEIRLLDLEAESINEEMKTSFSQSLLIRYRALMAKRTRLIEKMRELELLRVQKRESLKEAYRDLKSLEILRVNKEREDIIKNLNIESQRMGFIHLMRRRWKDV